MPDDFVRQGRRVVEVESGVTCRLPEKRQRPLVPPGRPDQAGAEV